MKENFKKKAFERLETAKWCIDRGFISSCVSNLYFAYFNFFQYVVGKPPKGRWKHIGIAKAFVHKAYRESLMPIELISKLKDSYDKLYALRRKADYTDELISGKVISEVKEYINTLHEALGYVS
ncbi:hypothetical protein JCM9492_13570 [Aquifex pyrophilus]